MFNLVRLIYTSRARFDSNPDSTHIEPEIAHILKQSRANNREAKISGVLYFADGYFFQCLEGQRKQVLDLVDKLEQDHRHEDLKVSYYRRTRRRRFRDWSMKYVPVGNEVMNLINERGYDKFTPCDFDESDINSVIDLFTRLGDPSLEHDDLRAAYHFRPGLWRRLFRLKSASML